MATTEPGEGSLLCSMGWWGQLGCGGVSWDVLGSAGMWWSQLGCLMEVLVPLLPPGFPREVSASLQKEN